MRSLSFLVTRSLTLSAGFVLIGCGGVVAPSDPIADSGTTTAESPIEWKDTPSCEAIKASCGDKPAVVVHGTSKGLSGLDGARVEFAVRYILEDGMGLDVPHGVALGRTHVKDSAFGTCVCVPMNSGMYPEIAAVVYAPGTTSLTSRDALRATFSRRYATGEIEDLSYALAAAPTDLQKEAAVAAMVARTERVSLGFATSEADPIYAGLVADDRPFAPQLATVRGRTLEWIMPGRPSTTERVALFIDKNHNGNCDLDGSDVGTLAPFAKTLAEPSTWLSGASLGPVCDALRVGESRE